MGGWIRSHRFLLAVLAGAGLFATAMVTATDGCAFLYRTESTSIGFGRPSSCVPIGGYRTADALTDWVGLAFEVIVACYVVRLLVRGITRRQTSRRA